MHYLDFLPLKKENLKNKLETIIKNENINITKKALKTLIKCSNFDFRRSLHILQCLKFKKIKEKHIYELTNKYSKKYLNYIFEIIYNKSFEEAYTLLKDINIDHMLDDFCNLLLKKNIKNKIHIIDKLSKLQLHNNVPNKLQLSYFLSIFNS